MERVSIFIDGSNFYYLVIRKLGIDETGFDFNEFATFLINGRAVSEMGRRFYTGTVSEKEGDIRTKEAMSKQTSLFTELKKNGWEIKTSKLRRRIEEIPIDGRVVDYRNLQKLGISKIQFERFREKGIDVKIATDLIVGAVDNQYDTAVIVSSDSDLIPAIDWVRHRKKKKVEYIGFSIPDEQNPKKSTNPLISLITKTDVKRILVKSDLKGFIKSDYLSYLMGAENINDQDLKNLSIKIDKTSDGDRELRIPSDKLKEYLKLIKFKLSPGFWNEVVSTKEIIFIFKFKNGAIKEYRLSPENEKEISKLCTEFNNDPIEKTSNVYKYISGNKFYYDFMTEYYENLINR